MLAMMSLNDFFGLLGLFGGLVMVSLVLLTKAALRNPMVRGAAEEAGKQVAKTALERLLRILAGK